MEDLQESARKLRIWSAFVTGCTYGIFLTIGTAWSECVKEVVITVLPITDHALAQSFVYACSATVICILVLILLVRCDVCVNRVPKMKMRLSKQIKISSLRQR